MQAAREALDRALRIDPDNGRCWALMGSLEQDIGNLPQAEYCFKRGTSAAGVCHATLGAAMPAHAHIHGLLSAICILTVLDNAHVNGHLCVIRPDYLTLHVSVISSIRSSLTQDIQTRVDSRHCAYRHVSWRDNMQGYSQQTEFETCVHCEIT